VLIVEDDPASSDILSQLLRHDHMQVDVAVTAEEALSLAAEHDYAFVVVDLVLPTMDGWELHRRLCAARPSEGIPAFLLTAYYDPRVAHRAKHAGFDGCFPKPATPALVEQFRRFYERRIGA
jgi:CheY-like chemotaxis protein